MTELEIAAYLSSLTDDELRNEVAIAQIELEKATDTEDHERQGECFAATYYFAKEMNARCIKLKKGAE